jgi:hypothetical protein
MNEKQLLKELMHMYEDEIVRGMEEGEEKNKVRILLAELVMNLTQVVLNMRICSDLSCACQPERKIQHLLIENQELWKKHLYPNQYEYLYNHFVKKEEKV